MERASERFARFAVKAGESVCDEHEYASAGNDLEIIFQRSSEASKRIAPKSITSYAVAMRLLRQFAAEVARKKIAQLTLDGLNSDGRTSVLNFLQESRSNAAQSRNRRLAALRTFFEYVGRRFPEPLGQAQKVMSIPKKTC